MSILLKVIQWSFRASSEIFPKMTERRAFLMFQKIRNKKIRTEEQAFYAKARHFKIPYEKEAIDAYEMGNLQGELVFLIHGWDSNAGCMGGVAELLTSDKRIVGFNLPAHGFHQAKGTNLMDSSRAFEAVLDYYRPGQPFSVIGHSFGSAVTVFTLSRLEYKVDKIVLLSTPDKLLDIFLAFKKMIHLGDKPFELLLERVHRIFGRPITELNIAGEIKIVHYDDLLVIHDEYDKVLDYKNAVAVTNVAPRATLLPFQKVGHYRMLWNKSVLDAVEDFFNT